METLPMEMFERIIFNLTSHELNIFSVISKDINKIISMSKKRWLENFYHHTYREHTFKTVKELNKSLFLSSFSIPLLSGIIEWINEDQILLSIKGRHHFSHTSKLYCFDGPITIELENLNNKKKIVILCSFYNNILNGRTLNYLIDGHSLQVKSFYIANYIMGKKHIFEICYRENLPIIEIRRYDRDGNLSSSFIVDSDIGKLIWEKTLDNTKHYLLERSNYECIFINDDEDTLNLENEFVQLVINLQSLGKKSIIVGKYEFQFDFWNILFAVNDITSLKMLSIKTIPPDNINYLRIKKYIEESIKVVNGNIITTSEKDQKIKYFSIIRDDYQIILEILE